MRRCACLGQFAARCRQPRRSWTKHRRRFRGEGQRPVKDGPRDGFEARELHDDFRNFGVVKGVSLQRQCRAHVRLERLVVGFRHRLIIAYGPFVMPQVPLIPSALPGSRVSAQAGARKHPGGFMTTPILFKEDLGLRRYDLDWVRIGAFMLLILYHVGMYYVTWDWHVKSPHPSATIEPLMMLSSPWRLSLLFLVSGVATGFLLARQGSHGFLRLRSARLLIPLVFGMLVIVPPQSYLQVIEKLGYAGSFAEFYRLYITGFHGFCSGGDCLIMPTWNHLWFVAYLWVYTVVLYIAVRLAPPVIPWLRRLAERRDRKSTR